MTNKKQTPVPRPLILQFCKDLGFPPEMVSEVELVLIEPMQVRVTLRHKEDPRYTTSEVIPVE